MCVDGQQPYTPSWEGRLFAHCSVGMMPDLPSVVSVLSAGSAAVDAAPTRAVEDEAID